MRSTAVKFEVTESKLTLCYACRETQLRIIKVIQQLKSLKLEKKENFFQTHAAGFIRLSYLVEKGKKVSKRFTYHYLIETR